MRPGHGARRRRVLAFLRCLHDLAEPRSQRTHRSDEKKRLSDSRLADRIENPELPSGDAGPVAGSVDETAGVMRGLSKIDRISGAVARRYSVQWPAPR
jgi:hypothetical protein